MRPTQIIASLNSLSLGDMEVIRVRLSEARRACLELRLEELAGKLAEASSALEQADLKTYRRRVETVIARLGHVK